MADNDNFDTGANEPVENPDIDALAAKLGISRDQAGALIRKYGDDEDAIATAASKLAEGEIIFNPISR